ncbi:hypothetical protein OROMI_033059 [Orobanche minor]
MSLTFSGDETAPFFSFLGGAALIFSCKLPPKVTDISYDAGIGAAYGTVKSGVGVASMGVMRPELLMKSIVPVVMAGILGPSHITFFDGYDRLSSGLACGLAGLAAGMAIEIVGDAGVRNMTSGNERKRCKII